MIGSVYHQGKTAGYRGTPRSDNPYRKGVPGMSATVDELAQTWDNGYHAGKMLAMQDIMEKHLMSFDDSRGWNAENLE